MTDYTPTTEEVRRGYSWNQLTNSYGINNGKEFDRWLDEVKAQALEVGYKSGVRNTVFPDMYVLDVNPYRQGETE